jgi:drug/metabolite transporter (DMT)-like permease
LLTLGLLISVLFIKVSLTILIFCLYPIYVLLFSIIVDKEKISLTVKILFFVTFLGIILVIGPSFKVINIVGILLAFLASLGSTSMIIVNQKMSIKGISPIPINIFINVFNTFFFFVILKIFFSLNFNFDINIYLLILIPSVCYSFALLSQLIAIPKIGQSYTALFLYLEPVVGVLGAVFLLNENLETYQMIGASIVIISLLSASFISSRN